MPHAALEDGESAVLLEALRNVAQAKGGRGALAKAAGVSSLLKNIVFQQTASGPRMCRHFQTR
jgi:hypothetical protein